MCENRVCLLGCHVFFYVEHFFLAEEWSLVSYGGYGCVVCAVSYVCVSYDLERREKENRKDLCQNSFHEIWSFINVSITYLYR